MLAFPQHAPSSAALRVACALKQSARELVGNMHGVQESADELGEMVRQLAGCACELQGTECELEESAHEPGGSAHGPGELASSPPLEREIGLLALDQCLALESG